jgi:hypothetical protein
MEGTASFSVGPLTGHPVSVIQTSFPVEPLVAAKASLKRPFPLLMPLVMVFWKYGYASIPTQSQASQTAELDPLTQAVQVSTCPILAPLKEVPAMADLTWLI